MMRCIVKSCGNRPMRNKGICQSCFVILLTGDFKGSRSAAWFVTELDFLEQQNNEAMRQIAHLHDKVNELSDG